LITLSIREAGGDVRAGITSAVRELAAGYELYSLNFIMGSRGHIWTFRYPEHNPLHLLERTGEGEPLDHRSAFGNMRVRAEDDDKPTVVISSERMDDSADWAEVAPGELIHIGPDLVVEREIVLEGPPAHQMVLRGAAAESQAYERDEPAAA
jgi:glutamine amidotransferase